MDLDDAADELYGLPPEEFVARRQAIARAEPAIAAQVRTLGKPTQVAHAANLLARRRPDDVAGLVALGEQMREATASLAGPELRALSQQRRALLRALVDAAVGLTGRRFSEQARQDLEKTFGAALADGDLARRLQLGRLTTGLSSSGLETLSAPVDAPPDEVGLRRAQRALQEARAALAASSGALQERRSEQADAESAEQAAAGEVRRQERALGAARRAHDEAAAAAAAAREGVAAAGSARATAQQEVDAAQATLDDVTRS